MVLLSTNSGGVDVGGSNNYGFDFVNHDERSCRNLLNNNTAVEQTLARLQLVLHHQGLTQRQPPQATVRHHDNSLRVVMLTTPELQWTHHILQTTCDAAILPADVIRGKDFRISERYRCIANIAGQAQGGIGFVYEAADMVTNFKVAVKLFHNRDDDVAAFKRRVDELAAGLRLHIGLHDVFLNRSDEEDLRHVVRLRDILIDAPLLDESSSSAGAGLVPTGFSCTAMVFDWANGGDAHTYMHACGGLSIIDGARIFKQLAQALRALHRRGIVHRDIKPENILLDQSRCTACLCDLGFAKHVPSSPPEDMQGDPTSCYQAPERWLASHGQYGARVRYAASGGLRVQRQDETPQALYAGDIFSAGVSVFMLMAYGSILNRLSSNPACMDIEEGDETFFPAMNIFQSSPGWMMFDLLDAGSRGGAQTRFWRYWQAYGLELPPAVRGLLDGVFHPVHEKRFTLDEAFQWMDEYPEMFNR